MFVFGYDTVLESFELLVEYFGMEWIQENSVAPLTGQKYHHLQEDIHPLISWFLSFPDWNARCEKQGELLLDQDTAKMTILIQTLKRIKDDKKFDKLISRLKNLVLFDATAFEIEVAARYIAKSYDVDFVEETDVSTPDLYIKDANGVSFWVECKYRERTNDVDKQTEVNWNRIERHLADYLISHKRNYQIVFYGSDRLSATEVPYICKFIINAIEKEFEPNHFHRLVGASQIFADYADKFSIAIYKLAEKDDELDGRKFKFPVARDKSNYGMFQCQRTDLPNGSIIMRNPFAIQYISEENKIQAIKNSFQAAVKQIPEAGPSIIHIRLPINSWVTSFDKTEAHIKAYLQNKLSGTQNRRVNAVMVSLEYTKLLTQGAFQYPTYEFLPIVVEHKNPRNPFTKPVSEII